ncbi:phosphohistidine phosphatase SixA [soil metagenome]
MDLYLVRHAIAEPRDSARWPDDSERPLTAAGIERFRAAARGLRRLGVEVDAVLASPYVRARHTAELLTKEAAWPSPEECRELEPSTHRNEGLDALRDRQESALALVGHQPLLSELASLLLAGDGRLLRLELKKGAAMCLRFDGSAEAGAAALRWSVSPKLLGSLGR